MPTATPSLSAALSHRMNYLVARQGLVSGNIANVDTPHYTAKDITFAGAVAGHAVQLATTNPKHLNGRAGVQAYGKFTEDKTNIRYDGNSVDLDTEMLKLNDIQLNYRLATQIYSKQTQLQKLALGRQ